MPTDPVPLPELPAPPPPPDLAAMLASPEFQAEMAALVAQAQAQLAALVAALSAAAAQLALVTPEKPPAPAVPVDPPPVDPMPIDIAPVDPAILLPPGPPQLAWPLEGKGAVGIALPVDLAMPVFVAEAGALAGPLAPLPQEWFAPAAPATVAASLAVLSEPAATPAWAMADPLLGPLGAGEGGMV